MKIDPEGLLAGARYIASPNCDERPPGCENLEQLPQRFEVIEPDAEIVKAKIRDAG